MRDSSHPKVITGIVDLALRQRTGWFIGHLGKGAENPLYICLPQIYFELQDSSTIGLTDFSGQ
jgi:hypothetical protein